MKKTLFTIFSIATVFCLFYGVPMTIINIGKDSGKVLSYGIVAGVGFIGLIVLATIIFINNKRKVD